MPESDRMLRWQHGVLLLALLLPFGEGGATPGALFLSHSLVMVGAVTLALLGSRGPRPPLLPPSLSTSVPAFVAVLVLASWSSPYLYASFLRCWDLGIALLLFVLVRRIGWESRDRQTLADCVLASASLQALAALAGSLSGRAPEILAHWGLLNSNHEAAYLNLGILLSTPYVLREKGTGRSLRGAGLLACLAALILLASRGAMLGLAAAAVLLWGMSRRESPPRIRRTVAAIGLLVLAGSLLTLVNRFHVAGDPFPYERARIWRADLQCFAGNPLLGVGPGIFAHVAHRFNFPLEGAVRYGRNFETPHSDTLGLLVETGVLGLAAGLFLMVQVFRLLLRQAREPGHFGTGLLMASTALAVQGMVEDLSRRPALFLTFAILAGAVSCRLEDGGGRVEDGAGWRRRLLFATAPLLLIGVVAVLNPYLAFRSDRAMRRAASLREMDDRFAAAVRANPYQSGTWRFPASAFLGTAPAAELTLDLYARFRRELDEGIRVDQTSADLYITRGRMEVRAFHDLFHDAATADRALLSYREGVKRVPRDPRPRLEMAGFLRELGRRREALEQVNRALVEEPGFLSARLLRACLLLEEGDRTGARQGWREARALRERLLTYRPDSAYAVDITRDHPPFEQLLQERLGLS